MKTIFVYILTAFILSQINNYVIDYRDSYCATYNGTLTTTMVLNNQNTMTQTTFSSSININKHNADSTISVSTSQGIFLCKLQSNRIIPISQPRLFGSFYNTDSVSFTIIFSSGPSKMSFKGKK